jgi:2'-5' RNA ligase
VRLFVALDLPAGVRRALRGWQQSVLGMDRRADTLRSVGEASLHVTLCFLGACAPAAVDRIVAACSAAAGFSVSSLAVGEPVWLPRRRPRVLAVAIEDDRGELRDVQALLSAELVRAESYEPEARLFFPHVTVARVRAGKRVRAAQLPGPEPVEFVAESVTLYRSLLSRGPAVYEPVHRVPLAAG